MTDDAPAKVRFVHLDRLIPYARNARTHSPAQVAQIAASIAEFGWTNPILADTQGIVAGHGRVLAARQLYDAGQDLRLPNGDLIPSGCVPVIDVDGWSDAKRRAYILADNQLALNAGWDLDLLRLELGELQAAGFDLDLVGFGDESLQSIFDKPSGELSENYSRKIEPPIYEVKGKRPELHELIDVTKANQLANEIAAADLPEDVAQFLLRAAERHVVFNFAQIAEYYAHASESVQRLMENSALVIVDFNRAIENGFIELSEELCQLAEQDNAS